jgi:hypothetical protein
LEPIVPSTNKPEVTASTERRAIGVGTHER